MPQAEGLILKPRFQKEELTNFEKLQHRRRKLFLKKATKMANWTENRLLCIQKEIFPKKNIIKKEKLDGVSKRFDKNGKNISIETYKEGKKHGKFYQETGNYYVTEHYSEGNKNGKWLTETLNKVPVKEVIYENETSYTEKKYHRNGKLDTEESFKEGKKIGTHKEYNDAGVLISEIKYNKEVEKKWHYNGVPEREAYYQNGQLHGKYIAYDRWESKFLKVLTKMVIKMAFGSNFGTKK